jgi:hypothetical protein
MTAPAPIDPAAQSKEIEACQWDSKPANASNHATPASKAKPKMTSPQSSSAKKRQRALEAPVEDSPRVDASFDQEFLSAAPKNAVEETPPLEEYGSKLQVVFYHPSESDRDFIWPGLLIPAEDRDPSMPKCHSNVRLVRFFQDFTYMILDDPADEENLDVFDPQNELEDYRQKVETLSNGGGKGYKLSHQKCLEFMETFKAPNELKWAKWKLYEKKETHPAFSGKKPRRA